MFSFIYTFRFKIIVRVFLLVIFTFLGNYLLFATTWQITPIVLMLMVFFVCIELIYFVEQQFAIIDRHLSALYHRDVSGLFSNLPTGQVFSSIKNVLNKLYAQISVLRKEKKSAELFAEQIISYTPSAMLCYKQNGEVILMNNALEKILGLPFLSDIKQIDKFIPGFLKAKSDVEKNNKALFSFNKAEKLVKISLQHSLFINEVEKIHIINIQDVSSQIAGVEVNSWQKLIRVLAHEIINSITPIASLSSKLYDIAQAKSTQLGDDASNKLSKGLFTISERSKSLISFVTHYRMFVVDPTLRLKKFDVIDLFQRTIHLLENNISTKVTPFKIKAKQPLEIIADMELIEQVIINLVLNAIDASRLLDEPLIILVAFSDNNNTCILRVIDKGMGMDNETKEKVFTPFFTTKEKGSGIGLSLSRQIVHLHKGTIDIYSEVGKGTAVTIELPLQQ